MNLKHRFFIKCLPVRLKKAEHRVCLKYVSRLYIWGDCNFRLPSRRLRVPGDTGGRGLTERKAIQNINDFGKTDTQQSVDTVSIIFDQTEQQNQEVLEGELEESGLI